MPAPLERLKSALADRYALEREIGSGGMASVYLAEDLKHHRQVAIKVLRPDLAAVLGPERFLREIEIAARLQHPNILPLLDSGETAGFLYYVMPYIEGQSLRERLRKEIELPIGEAVRILWDVVDALTEAHAHGVIHRDIKPENILLRGRHALVTDFGVAKAVSEATGREQLTTAGVALGTPAYMAPEQAYADPHVDHRVDIYAVGAVAYELLTGRPVFLGSTSQQILSAHVSETPQPVTQHRSTVPPALEQVVMRCLEKKPADRFQTAEELLPLLESLTTPTGGVTPTNTRPVPAAGRRSRWLVPGVLAAAMLIVVGFLGSRLLTNAPVTVMTSNIRAVTSDPSMDFHPALSPDGSQVAFVSMRNGRWDVHVRGTRGIGGEATLTRELTGAWKYSIPRWSADGDLVRFRACDDHECVWREVGRLGGPIRTLDVPDGTWSWSPNGSRVVMLAGDSILTYAPVDADTTLAAVHEAVEPHHSPVWSPDGNRIAYVNGNVQWVTSFNVSNSSIWIVDTDHGAPVQVTGGERMDVSPAWIDDDHLLFVSNRGGPREVYVVEVGPDGARGEPLKVPGIIDPHWISYSIASGKLAFAKATERQNIRSFPLGPRTMSVAAGSPITDENAVIEEHDISPDGRWLAYCSNVGGTMDIYRRDLATGSTMRVTDLAGDEFAPKWSPDGTEIVFYGGLSAEDGVMVVGADGGTPATLANGPGWNNSPRWSPSGLEIAFRSSRTGRTEVWTVSRAVVGGTWGDPVQLTDFGCFPYDWAPDGSGVLCRAGTDLVLVSPEGDVAWRYTPSMGRMQRLSWSRYSRDGSTIYLYGIHEDGAEGIWALSPQSGTMRMAIAFDHAELMGTSMFSIGRDQLYVTVSEVASDVWVADLQIER